ncbi:MAG: aminopeptidase P family protein [Thermoanaerobaculia bacterium]
MLATETYVQRRLQLKEAVDSGLVLFLGHDESPMNYKDNPYPFRQDSSFLYYFGIDSPGLAGLIDIDGDTVSLFGNDASLEEIVWTGPQLTLAELGARVGVAECHPYSKLGLVVGEATEIGRSVHFLPPSRAETILKAEKLLKIPSSDIEQCVSQELIRAVVEQRLLKSDEEVAEIEKALSVAADMHTLAMRMSRPGMKEQEVVGAIDGLVSSQGSALAFPIIFSKHGEVLHNHKHGNTLEEGDLVILDAGANSPAHYASDITRTFAIGVPFDDRQKQVYETVLRAQMDSIAAVEPETRFEDVHLLACRRLTEGLQEMSLMKGDVEESVTAGAHALFFPHGLGHMMGLDVHDMEGLSEDLVGYGDEAQRNPQFGRCSLRLARALKPGFVVTIEPGLYFIPDLIDQWREENRFPEFIDYEKVEGWKDFRGVRIEDDVLVTADGHRVLGEPIPKEVADVEKLSTA